MSDSSDSDTDSTNAEDKPEEEGDNSEFIILKLVLLGRSDMNFRINRTTQIENLKRSYADKLGQVIHQRYLRFLFNGTILKDDATPEQLMMKTGDVIKVWFLPKSINRSDTYETYRLQSQIRRVLQCVVCLKPSASPIYNCLDNGHLVCGFCHDKFKTTEATICPSCECKTFQPSPVAERQSRDNDMRGICPFSGCFDCFLVVQLMAHAKTCEYRDIQCTSARIGGSEEACNKMFPLEEFPLHAIEVHQVSFENKNIESDSVGQIRLEVPFMDGNEESEKYWGQSSNQFGQLLCKYEEKYFTVQHAIRNYIFYWWVTIYGGQREADRYQYETELLWVNVDGQMHVDGKMPKDVIVQTHPVLPYIRYENYYKSCGNYAMVHAATATAYSTKATDDNPPMIRLTLRIRISNINSVFYHSVTPGSEGTKRKADSTDATDEFEIKKSK